MDPGLFYPAFKRACCELATPIGKKYLDCKAYCLDLSDEDSGKSKNSFCLEKSTAFKYFICGCLPEKNCRRLLYNWKRSARLSKA